MAMHAYRFHSLEADGPWTSEPFPAAERRHIVQGVIAGFLSGRPRWATDVDGTFIYGLDAKGKEMKAAPVHHATKKTVKTVTVTAKKSPAQLQREIDEALAGKGGATSEDLTPAQRAYVVLFEQDVNNHPDAYKAEVRANPGKHALRTIDGLDDEDVRQFTRDLRDEIKLVERTSRSRAGHATKKRASHPRVVGKHGLGTADVRTSEGAYWIVTVPTGYRVDYKPWGPSNEVDLGTFKSRAKARAKITAHTHGASAGAAHHATKKLPSSLHAAYEWTAAAGELAELARLRGRALKTYANKSAANAREHAVFDVHATDIVDLAERL